MAEAYSTEAKDDGQPSSEVMTAHARYEQLKTEREPFLRRARECAEVTIPHLMPPEGFDGNTDLPTPYQSVGSRGVTNITAKLLLALFPPGSAYFRLDIVRRLLDKMNDAQKSEMVTALAKYESEVRNTTERKGNRTQLNEALEQLVNSGNFLLKVQQDCSLKGHALDHYVVKRDLSGTVYEIIVLEALSKKTAPAHIRALISEEQTTQPESKTAALDRIDIYTWIRRDPSGRYWKIHQEVCGKVIPESHATEPLDKPSWLPLRWSVKAGEDYGRGYCERYLGDLISCDRHNRAIIDFSAAASKVLPMVKPGGQTRRRDVARAKNLEVIEGEAKDVTFLQMEKFADFKVTESVLQRIEKRLEQAFLLLSGSQRDAERVTAEEIRFLAQELEVALGGAYSVLAQELQRPLIVRVLAQMQKNGDVPALPDKAIEPQIVTGLAGLGRTSDLQRINAWIEGISEHFGTEAAQEVVNVSEYANRSAAALSIDTSGGLIRTEKQIQDSRAQKAQQELAAKLAPKGMELAAQSQQQKGENGSAPETN